MSAIETLVTLPSSLVPVSEVKGLLILQSIGSLRAEGLFERYEQCLEPSFRAPVLQCVAGQWLLVRIAAAHYRACDALGLSPQAQQRLGRGTAEGVSRHLSRVAALVTRGLGITPWALLQQFPRLWSQVFRGGGIAIDRIGPNEAHLTYAECSLLEIAYFRSALRGVAMKVTEVAARSCSMHEVAGGRSAETVRYHLQWT